MARAVFQMVQDHTPTSEISSTKIKRGQDRSLSITEETTSLTKFIKKQGKNYDNKNKHLRRFHTKKVHISILSFEKIKK
jgi:hypothetical protein